MKIHTKSFSFYVCVWNGLFVCKAYRFTSNLIIVSVEIKRCMVPFCKDICITSHYFHKLTDIINVNILHFLFPGFLINKCSQQQYFGFLKAVFTMIMQTPLLVMSSHTHNLIAYYFKLLTIFIFINDVKVTFKWYH